MTHESKPKRLLAVASAGVLLVGAAGTMVVAMQNGQWSQWTDSIAEQTTQLAAPIAMNRASDWAQENAGLSERARLDPLERKVSNEHTRLVDSSARSPLRIDQESELLVDFRDLNLVSRKLREAEAEALEERLALETGPEEETLVGWTGPAVSEPVETKPAIAPGASSFGQNQSIIDVMFTGNRLDPGVAEARTPQAAANVTVEADTAARVLAQIAVIQSQASTPPANGSFLARAGQLGFTDTQIQSIPDTSSGGGSNAVTTSVNSVVNNTGTRTDLITEEVMPDAGDSGAPAVVPMPAAVIPGLILLGSISLRRRRTI